MRRLETESPKALRLPIHENRVSARLTLVVIVAIDFEVSCDPDRISVLPARHQHHVFAKGYSQAERKLDWSDLLARQTEGDTRSGRTPVCSTGVLALMPHQDLTAQAPDLADSDDQSHDSQVPAPRTLRRQGIQRVLSRKTG